MSKTENTIQTKQDMAKEIESLEKQKDLAIENGNTSLAKLYESDIMILKKKLRGNLDPQTNPTWRS